MNRSGAFSGKPRTRLGWWAFGLGISTLFISPILGTFAAVGRPLLDRIADERIGIAVGILFVIAVLLLLVTALVLCISALWKGERSWAVWVGFVIALLSFTMMAGMVVGEILIPH